MPGDGTSPATTRADMVVARLLDVTRSMRRAGRLPTGVDRVERAYLAHLLLHDVPLFGLVRTPLGYLLLDQQVLQDFLDRLERNEGWPAADPLSRLPRRKDAALAQAETMLRSGATARCPPFTLPRMLARHLPGGFEYYNVGHSNLTKRVLEAVKSANGQISVMIHDVIPLEHPEFQRPGTIASFREKLMQVGKLADRVIYNSADTAQRAEGQMRKLGRVPPSCVSHLGTITPMPDLAEVPAGVLPAQPFFMTIGTIEPRKNHAFLMDLWDVMGTDAPPLLFCGSRGWNNDAVFKKLDNLPKNASIQEVSALSDAALAALIQRSAGVLLPTHAEGFGLPAVEALMLGARVLCNNLEVFTEILGDCADLVPVADSQRWLELIKRLEEVPSNAGDAKHFVGPSWADHFNIVLRLN